MVSFTVNDQASPAIRALIEQLRPSRAHRIAAFGVRGLIRDHLARKNQMPNKRGWRKTNFYARARRTVIARGSESSGEVSIAHEGFAQRFYGGIIRPVKAKALTIPAIEIAYGRRAREVKDLKFQPVKSGNILGILYRNVQGRRINYYWLARLVNQPPEPSVLPTEDEMKAAAAGALGDAVDQALR